MMLTQFQNFLKCDRIFTPSEVEEMCDMIAPFVITCTDKGIKYLDIPCSFDIETSNFLSTGKKTAIMYVWQLGLYGLVMVGRTWDEYIEVYNYLCERYHLHDKRRLVIFVHNLSYEFSFLAKRHTWLKVFAAKERTPIYATTIDGVEYRCSYLLSGYSLELLAKNLKKYQIEKLVGELDYSIIRNSKTFLNERELAYCINDVKIVMCYIAELAEKERSIAKFPITKTGFARRYCREKCFATKEKRIKYNQLMRELTIEPDEYLQMKRAFCGGFTHASPFWVSEIVNNVTSFDFTSSYPTVMVSEQFPMSKGELYYPRTQEDFENCIHNYCCIFDIKINNIRPKIWNENYLSKSKCYKYSEHIITNNGRVVSADMIQTTITDVDYFLLSKYYMWDSIKIANLRRYRKAYLPKDFVLSILELYRAKTELKNVSGKEEEYLNAKELLNSLYGMCVTDIVRDELNFTHEWVKTKADVNEQIQKYNVNKNRFTFYAWGIYVTAYARRALFTGIYEFGEDYIYSDTDSIKVAHAEKHMNYITKYNDYIIKRLKHAMDYHGLSYDYITPKTIKGIEKPLGVWDFDGKYEKFKTLGAKRYLVKYSNDERNGNEAGEYKLTVSGLNKKKTMPYLLKKYKNVFAAFTDDLYIPAEYTGKLTHTYIDEERQGIITDYQGNTDEYHEYTSVHLSPSDYDMSITSAFLDYICYCRILD